MSEAKAIAPSKATGRPRGRPPRLSRARILDAALAVLEREPNTPPTVASIATQAKAAPAALYRHFDSLDELLDSLLARVLLDEEDTPVAGETWEAELADWMGRLRNRLLRYPALLRLIGQSGRTSPAWLEASSSLVELLQRAGLKPSELAPTYLWVLETTVGLVMQEVALPFADQLENARQSRNELSENARARFAVIAPELECLDSERFFSFFVQQATLVVGQQRRTLPSGPQYRVA